MTEHAESFHQPGQLPPAWEQVYEQLRQHGPLTTHELNERHLRWLILYVETVCRRLADRGLAHCDEQRRWHAIDQGEDSAKGAA